MLQSITDSWSRFVAEDDKDALVNAMQQLWELASVHIYFQLLYSKSSEKEKSNMKFSLNHNPANKTLAIPRAALQLSGLADVSDLLLHTDSGCILLLPGDPTVAELLKTIPSRA